MPYHPEMTRAAGHRSISSHAVGRLQVGANIALYALPRAAPAALELVAFPGDCVPFQLWPSLAGATGDHPHSGGLLGALFGRLERAGVAATTALLVVEPAGFSGHHALFSQLLPQITASGEPARGYDGGQRTASSHLALVYDAVARAAATEQVPSPSPDADLIAMGFSKGCVVANQLLAELAHAADVPSMPGCDDARDAAGGQGGEEAPRAHRCDGGCTGASVLSRLWEVHLLDAGLQCRGAHLTDPAVAAALGARPRPPRLFVHGTPRQWRDPTRRWLVEEKDRSVALLRASGVQVVEREYYETQPPSLEMHFRLCDDFETQGRSLIDHLAARLKAAG
jgi:hypothetical protein